MAVSKIQREEMISELTDFVQVEATIECTNYNTCKSIESDYDEDSLAAEVYSKGWRVINGDVFCKGCAKKEKLK